MSGIFVKLALLFQYLRLFQAQPSLIRVCRYLIVVTVVYGVIVTFVSPKGSPNPIQRRLGPGPRPGNLPISPLILESVC